MYLRAAQGCFLGGCSCRQSRSRFVKTWICKTKKSQKAENSCKGTTLYHYYDGRNSCSSHWSTLALFPPLEIHIILLLQTWNMRLHVYSLWGCSFYLQSKKITSQLSIKFEWSPQMNERKLMPKRGDIIHILWLSAQKVHPRADFLIGRGSQSQESWFTRDVTWKTKEQACCRQEMNGWCAESPSIRRKLLWTCKATLVQSNHKDMEL